MNYDLNTAKCDNEKDEYFMSIALEEAQKAADEGEIPVGAVLVRDGKILAVSHNRRESDNDATAHAEILCIRKSSEEVNYG